MVSLRLFLRMKMNKERSLADVRRELSLSGRVSSWGKNKKDSWEECRKIYCKPNFNERYPELSKMYAKPGEQEIAKLKEDYEDQCRQYNRKTIAARLFEMQGERGLEQAYNEIYGKTGWFGIDFGKKKKMQMLRHLLDSENLDEAERTYNNYSGAGVKMPERYKLLNYIRNYFNGRMPVAFISGRKRWAFAA